MFARLLASIRRRFRGRFEENLRDEIAAHIAHRADDLMKTGMTREGAERRARVEFGGVESYKEQIRDTRAISQPAALVAGLLRDVRFGIRRLAAAPIFTLFSIVTLALGIGVTTAVYSFLYAFVWQPTGVRDVGQVVVLNQPSPSGQMPATISKPDYEDFVRLQGSLGGIAVWAGFSDALAGHGSARLVQGSGVNGDYFRVLGIEASVGRLIQPDDDRAGAPRVAVLSDDAWRTQFGADPHVVGTAVKIGPTPFEVIGIAPASFHGLGPRRGPTSDSFWIPLSHAASLTFRARLYQVDQNNRQEQWLRVAGRLAVDRDRPFASGDAVRIAQSLDNSAPLKLPSYLGLAEGQRKSPRGWTMEPANRSDFGGGNDVARAILSLPALVLLIACTNLANLVLSRGMSRQHEFAVRRAIGASRWRLIREQLIEQGIIATLGGLAGVFVARGLISSAISTVSTTFGYRPEFQIEASLQPAVLGAAAVAALLALLVSGLVPTIQLTRGGVRGALARGGSAAALPGWRGRGNLIALQVGVTVALLLVAALGVRAVISESRAHPASGDRQLAVVSLPIGAQVTDVAQIGRTIDGVLSEIRRRPGIESAAASINRRFRGLSEVAATSPGRPFQVTWTTVIGHVPELVQATPDIFRTIGAPLRAGRTFEERDRHEVGSIAVISEGLARSLYATADVVGRQLLTAPLTWRGSTQTVDVTKLETRTIIGVATDTRTGKSVDEVVYVPFGSDYAPDISIYARTQEATADGAVSALLTAVRHVDPELAVIFAGRADVMNSGPNLWLGLLARAAGALAFLALALSMAGLYGVLSHVVTRRMREMGVRIALGADAGRIVRLVLKDGVRPVIEGLVIGLGIATAVRLALQPMFNKPITAIDPLAFLIAFAPLVVAALIACYLPARRAAHVDPNVALREL